MDSKSRRTLDGSEPGASGPYRTDSVALESLTIDDGTVIDALPPGSCVASRYTIEELLGRGGYGVVYRATDTTTGLPVALKILRADRASASATRRFAREAVAARRVTHPNLVRVLDCGEDDGRFWMAMELIDGEPLKARLVRGPLAVPEVARLGREILEALHAMHEAGIVHRDVKPGNILIDHEGRARLADLGLVTQLDADESYATQTGALVGTLAYLSPEMALGRPATPRSDLYSMGITLYEALSGTPPHQGTSSLGTVIARITAELPPVDTLRRDVPTWLSRAIARLVEREPADRYPSARDAARDLAGGRFTPGGAARRAGVLRVVAASGLGLAAFLVWAGLAGRAQVKPALATAEVKAGRLRALDSSSAVLWETRLVGAESDSAYEVPRDNEAARLRVVDMDGDGMSEVLVVVQDRETLLGKLHVYESDGRLRYTRTATHVAHFGKEAFTSFSVAGTFAFEDDSGRARIFVAANHVSYFPSVVEEVDARGATVAEYWSSGQALWASPVRYEGQPAIAIGGYSSETRGGAVAIVALDDISGSAPSEDPRYRCIDCPSLRPPMRYIMFPPNDVVRGLSGDEGAVAATAVRPTDRGLVDVATVHGTLDMASGRVIRPHVAYRLDDAFSSLTSVLPGSEFMTAHDLLHTEGRIDHEFGARDLGELSKVRVWTGTGYRPLPEANRPRKP